MRVPSYFWTLQSRHYAEQKTHQRVSTRRGHRADAEDASPHQTKRGIDMALDFIENHRQNIFVLHIT